MTVILAVQTSNSAFFTEGETWKQNRKAETAHTIPARNSLLIHDDKSTSGYGAWERAQ